MKMKEAMSNKFSYVTGKLHKWRGKKDYTSQHTPKLIQDDHTIIIDDYL